jgi:hypothetical protein
MAINFRTNLRSQLKKSSTIAVITGVQGMKKVVFAAIAAGLLVSAPAHAVTGNIPFNGSVSNTCVITVGGSGTLAASTDYTVLGSEQTGGSAGTASVLATGAGFSLSADAPTSFSTAPATGNNNVVFEANYAATGANNIAKTDGLTKTVLSRGTSAVTINMSGTKTSGTFEAGPYAATVILRCE